MPTLDMNRERSEYTVSEVSKIIKTILEGHLTSVRIRGEISGFKRHGSGHLYFSLKDDTAVLKAVCWRGVAGKVDYTLQDGLEVICEGDISAYPAQSSYQIIASKIEVAGEGALLKILEERKQKLQKEGLFDKARLPLPRFPKTIGIITSSTGAVIQDILRRLEERFPVNVWLWPVAVQGEDAARQVAAAIRGFNACKARALPHTPDVLIVARGGGSVEDLFPFNDEDIVRAAFESRIPLISAIGHETDTTLIDYASDRRAPTPTAAAEIAVPDLRRDLHRHLKDQHQRAQKALDRLALNSSQRLDDKSMHLLSAFRAAFDRRISAFNNLKNRLRHPKDLILMKEMAFRTLQHRFQTAFETSFERTCTRFQHQSLLLESYSHTKTLERGFCLVKSEDGVVKRARNLDVGQSIDLIFYDASKKAIITSKTSNKKQSKQRITTQEHFDF